MSALPLLTRAASNALTRRQLLRRAGAAAALAAEGAVLVELLRGRRNIPRIPSFAIRQDGPVSTFRSRPDLRPPTITATAASELLSGGEPPGFLFLGPGPVSLTGSEQYGPLVVDRRGEPVWFRPMPQGVEVTNFTASRYRDQPVLVWWEGKIASSGYGQGEVVIVDRSYRELARVRAANGRSMDLHALWLTPHGTALFTCYPETVQIDLSSIGGPRQGDVIQSIIQEVDVASGKLLFEWRSLQHIPVEDSHEPLAQPYDYLHVNSIAPAADGNLLVSGRHTWSVYKLERRTGNVIWTLGGERSDFAIESSAQFAWQHDARQLSDGLLTLFDNGSNGTAEIQRRSRGLILELDEPRGTVALRQAYTSPEGWLATSMGSVQVLPSERVIVGWGTAPHVTEFAKDGRLLFDAALPLGLYSYRGSWLPWSAVPRDSPALAAGRDSLSGAQFLYASWNGATEVTDWRLDAGSTSDRLRPIGIARRRGFETAIPVSPHLRFAAVTALDRSGSELRSSDVIRI